MIYWEYPPSRGIEPFVEGFWYLRRRGPSAWEPIYPDGSSELIFNLSDPADELRRGRVVRQPSFFAYGQIDRRILVRSAVDTEVLAIRLRPWGASVLLGTPGSSLADGSVPLRAISPAIAGRLAPIIEDRLPVAAKVARLDRCLDRWIRSRACGVPATAGIARYLQSTPAATVDDVGRLTGWSSRTAQRRFRSDVGLTPKRFLQVTRFMRFVRLLDLEPETPLSQLAVAAGYYDQPHLHRDLRRFTGATPARFRSRDRTPFDSLYGRERLAHLVAL